MSYLTNLTTDQILSQPLPLKQILSDCFYYPACGFDGQLVKFAPNDIINFIYCDHSVGQNALLQNLQNEAFRGYSVFASRDVNQAELVPNGWRPQLPPTYSSDNYSRIRQDAKPSFARWFVFERQAEFGLQHGPQRFSLLYVGGEGVATYQALFWTNKIVPQAVAIIQPGTGFGGNWTNFSSVDGSLFWVINANPNGRPPKIYYGGTGSDYTSEFGWKDYIHVSTIKPYYGDGLGELTIWRHG